MKQMSKDDHHISAIINQSSIRTSSRNIAPQPKKRLYSRTPSFWKKIDSLLSIPISEGYFPNHEESLFKLLEDIYSTIIDERKSFDELVQYFQIFEFDKYLTFIMTISQYQALDSRVLKTAFNILSLATDYKEAPLSFYYNENLLLLCNAFLEINPMITLNIYQNGIEYKEFLMGLMPQIPKLLAIAMSQPYCVFLSKLAQVQNYDEPNSEVFSLYVEAVHKIFTKLPQVDPESIDPFNDYYIDESIFAYAFESLHNLYQWELTDINVPEKLFIEFGSLISSIPLLLCAKKKSYFIALFKFFSHYPIPIQAASMIISKALQLQSTKLSTQGNAVIAALEIIDANLEQWGEQCADLFVPFLRFIDGTYSFDINSHFFRIALFSRPFVKEIDDDTDLFFIEQCFKFLEPNMLKNILIVLLNYVNNERLVPEILERIEQITELNLSENDEAFLIHQELLNKLTQITE